MKHISYIYSSLIAFILVVALVACDKSLDQTTYEPYPETNIEATGGTWKTYIVANGSETALPAPEATTTVAYQMELANLKATMAATTTEQQDAARYWGGNGVLRWHEITRQLAAQYNSAPKNNPDGTYPMPDPANPTVYPRFPFANPPYTARALALLSVAHYDALVSAWHHKFQHNRLAPYKNDASITPLIPSNDLPSYPSEDAVVAAASREILKYLFPGEKALLEAQSTEHKNSRLWAGANVQSDLDAGDSLGVAVAKRIIAYAKADLMSGANKQADVPLLRADATSRGITRQWTSLEKPERPPLLPFYGNVKTWNFTSTEKVLLRPAAPPAFESAEFTKALDELRDIAKNRSSDQYRIASFWADGTGSYTPPGHWDRRASELIYAAQMNELRSARTMALMNTAVQDAGISCWDIKYFYLLPRPTEVDPSIKTSTGIPNFPAYTSGHSTFSGAAAEVLSYVFPYAKSELEALAHEASESRIYGCIHYRFDCEIGLSVGKKVGEYAVTRGKNDGSE